MMAKDSGETKVDKAKPNSKFEGILSDLENILTEVKQSDTQLDQSLDLFEEALSKAAQAAELSDNVDISELDLADNSTDESSDEVEPSN